ncbi:MAG TPA: YidB family protein [Candidatus Acidoferrum sp.]|nr:YidB family protein [Candidatus Acidoferrum sp.]
MGIFDEIEKVGGSVLGGSTLGGEHAGALSAVTDYINSPQVGGISGLQKMFQEKGLGGIVSSWIGTGQNLPISTDQLNSVLHCDALNQVATKFGLDPNMLQSMMTQLLPHVVDKMTPNGQAAAAGQ